MRINEFDQMLVEQHANVKLKAGLIPYCYTGGGRNKTELKMMFAVSSDPAHGGTQPMIAKGHVEPGEDIQEAAIRESGEELGLKISNFFGNPFYVSMQKITGYTASYDLHIFAVQVKNRKDFEPHDNEIGSVHWLTFEEYQKYGRRSQLSLVQTLVNKLKSQE